MKLYSIFEDDNKNDEDEKETPKKKDKSASTGKKGSFRSSRSKIRDKDQIGNLKQANTDFEKAITASGLTQSELADKIDVDKSTISRYKHDVRKPSYDSLAELIDTLGYQAEDLFPELDT